jgi:hypothetical protein
MAIAEHIRQHRELSEIACLIRLFDSFLMDRAWPFAHYSKALLMSAAARRQWIAPDIRQLAFAAAPALLAPA